jgi:hypothetical protein
LNQGLAGALDGPDKKPACTVTLDPGSDRLKTKDKQAEQNKVGPNSQAEQVIMNLENELVKRGSG